MAKKKYTAQQRKAYAMGYAAQCAWSGTYPYIGEENVPSYAAGRRAALDGKKSPLRHKRG